MKSRSKLTIHLNRLSQNIESIKKIVGSKEIIAMVKADAYGHGMIPITEFLHSSCSINEFGCASLSEAIILRRQLSDHQFEIYVFSDNQIDSDDSPELYAQFRLIPVLSSLKDLDYFLHHDAFLKVPLVLKFNTGMNRLGFKTSEVSQVISRLKRHQRKTISHLMSHMANASFSLDSDPKNISQINSFHTLKKTLSDEGIVVEKSSLANSGSIEQGMTHFKNDTHVRPGIMLYGASSLQSDLRKNTLFAGKIISTLETRVLKVFNIERNETIGYNSTEIKESGVVVILAIGYGDGFHTYYRGSKITISGVTGNVVGRINMDMIQVFFPSDLHINVKEGEVVKIWDEDPRRLHEFSDQVGTIPYEVFCSLLPRVSREYRLN